MKKLTAQDVLAMNQAIRDEYELIKKDPFERLHILASQNNLTQERLVIEYRRLLETKGLKPMEKLKILNSIGELVIKPFLPKQIELGDKTRESMEKLSAPLQQLVDEMTAPKEKADVIDVVDVTPLELVK